MLVTSLIFGISMTCFGQDVESIRSLAVDIFCKAARIDGRVGISVRIRNGQAADKCADANRELNRTQEFLNGVSQKKLRVINSFDTQAAASPEGANILQDSLNAPNLAAIKSLKEQGKLAAFCSLHPEGAVCQIPAEDPNAKKPTTVAGGDASRSWDLLLPPSAVPQPAALPVAKTKTAN